MYDTPPERDLVGIDRAVANALVRVYSCAVTRRALERRGEHVLAAHAKDALDEALDQVELADPAAALVVIGGLEDEIDRDLGRG